MPGAYRIKGCGCDCATMPADPCVPCNGGGAFQLQCRSRSGLATLCGHPEFGTASTPPRRYKVLGVSGGYSGQTKSSCVILLNSYFASFSGSAYYVNSGAGSCTLVGAISGTGDGGSASGLTTPNSALVSGWLATGSGGIQTVLSKTRRSSRWANPDNSCGGCVVSTQASCDEVQEFLTDEDTEEKAMDRTTSPWGPWLPGAGGSGCCTTKGVRGAGLDFNFSESQFRIRVAGQVGTPINLKITYTRSNGPAYSEVRQFFPASTTFPSNSEEGWEILPLVAATGSQTCLSNVEPYDGT